MPDSSNGASALLNACGFAHGAGLASMTRHTPARLDSGEGPGGIIGPAAAAPQSSAKAIMAANAILMANSLNRDFQMVAQWAELGCAGRALQLALRGAQGSLARAERYTSPS